MTDPVQTVAGGVFATLKAKVEAFIAANPKKAVIAALAVGFVAAHLI